MPEETFGFDAFARKWVPPASAWQAPAAGQSWRAEASEEERRRKYLDDAQLAGGKTFAFGPGVMSWLKQEFAAESPIFSVLDHLLMNPEVGGCQAISVLLQRVFGVPASRAGFVASWQPSNRRPETQKILQRVSLCIADARRAGLWAPPGEEFPER